MGKLSMVELSTHFGHLFSLSFECPALPSFSTPYLSYVSHIFQSIEQHTHILSLLATHACTATSENVHKHQGDHLSSTHYIDHTQVHPIIATILPSFPPLHLSIPSPSCSIYQPFLYLYVNSLPMNSLKLISLSLNLKLDYFFADLLNKILPCLHFILFQKKTQRNGYLLSFMLRFSWRCDSN